MKANSRNILLYILLCSLLVITITGLSGCMFMAPEGEQATQQPAGEQPAQTGEPDGKPMLGSTQPPQEVLPWTGVWESGQWGTMELMQSGNTVTGVYEWDDGKIEGTVSSNMLRGTWSESPTYAPQNDAGDFEFTLSADGNSFTGHWRYGSESDWEGDWTAEKISG